jgi:flagellar hook assembly protein FlgD
VPNLHIHNYPNPLETDTRFVIGLPADGEVNLTIYDRAGELIRRVLEQHWMQAGIQLVDWRGDDDSGRLVAPGTYVYVFEYTLEGKTDRIIKKLVVARD